MQRLLYALIMDLTCFPYVSTTDADNEQIDHKQVPGTGSQNGGHMCWPASIGLIRMGQSLADSAQCRLDFFQTVFRDRFTAGTVFQNVCFISETSSLH